VTLPTAGAADGTGDVTWYNGDPTDTDSPGTSITSVTLILPTGELSVDTTLYIDPLDDTVMDEGMEMFELTSGGVTGGGIGVTGITGTVNAGPTSFMMDDDDPDVTITFNGMDELSIAEDAGSEQTVTVTVMDPAGNMAGVDRTFTVTIPGTAAVGVGGTTAIGYTTRGLAAGGTLQVVLGPGATSATGTFYLTPTANSGDVNSTIAATAVVAPANRTNGVAYTIGVPSIILVDSGA
jgi:hypothetical protein